MKKRNILYHFYLQNRPLLRLSLLYIVFMLSAAAIACLFAYRERQTSLASQSDNIAYQISQYYRNTVNNFWQLYMPLYESNNSAYRALEDYFTNTKADMTPSKRNELSNALYQMMLRDNQVRWIALYSGERQTNYILFAENSFIKELPEDFPYMSLLEGEADQMAVYGMHPVRNNRNWYNTFAIRGGIPLEMGSGSILIGYDISALNQICANSVSPIDSMKYYLVSGDELIFSSDRDYDISQKYLTDTIWTGTTKAASGEKLYVDAQKSGVYMDLLIRTANWWDVFFYYHFFTPWLLLITILFITLSTYVYILMLKSIGKEVNTIREGLNEIGDNHLDYRITTDFKQTGLSEIADSINHMTVRLSENINRAYYYELRKREAELSELQSKFNPHFLYNSLEMLRARCYQNNDEATAELISQLSAIFRGFIGSSTFVSLKEELSFNEHYLALFGARYEDQLQVLYDIDRDLFQYGIIRNIFQPLIENYFVHGFDSSESNNYILIKGKSLDEQNMVFTVEDNGIGMSDNEIEQMNARFHEPMQLSTESYGLKNLHQRLSMFYGGNCGLTIQRNHPKGIRIRLVIRKMTCEEYQNTQKHT